ncbi:MAG: DUF4192 family protein, partial [Thermomicrobiales bacterium]
GFRPAESLVGVATHGPRRRFGFRLRVDIPAIDDVDERGYLTNVTEAVMASTRKSHYAHTPRGFFVPWGQGPLALAICEAAQLP